MEITRRENGGGLATTEQLLAPAMHLVRLVQELRHHLVCPAILQPKLRSHKDDRDLLISVVIIYFVVVDCFEEFINAPMLHLCDRLCALASLNDLHDGYIEPGLVGTVQFVSLVSRQSDGPDEREQTVIDPI